MEWCSVMLPLPRVWYISVADLEDKHDVLSFISRLWAECVETHFSSWDDSSCSSMCGWSVWLLIGLWWWWEFMAGLSRLEMGEATIFTTASYHNSCPHSSGLSGITGLSACPLSPLLPPLWLSRAACSKLLQFLIWSVYLDLQEFCDYFTDR